MSIVVLLQLFVQGPNPGVNIEFTIPKVNGTRTKTSYSWRYSSWSKCSAKCGIGNLLLLFDSLFISAISRIS